MQWTFRGDYVRNSVVPEACTQATELLPVLCILHEHYRIVKGNVSIEPMNAVDGLCEDNTE